MKHGKSAVVQAIQKREIEMCQETLFVEDNKKGNHYIVSPQCCSQLLSDH